MSRMNSNSTATQGMNWIPHGEQHRNMPYQTKKRPLPEDDLDYMGQGSRKVLISSTPTESLGDVGSVQRGSDQPAVRGKNYLQNRKKSLKRKLKRKNEAMQASFKSGNTATSWPDSASKYSRFPGQRGARRGTHKYAATRKSEYSPVREYPQESTHSVQSYSDLDSRDHGYDADVFSRDYGYDFDSSIRDYGHGSDRDQRQSSRVEERVLGYEAHRYGDYY